MGGGGGSGQGGGGGGLIGQLLKPLMTGKDDPLGLGPQSKPPAVSFLEGGAGLPTMATPQTTDRLAFLRSFGIQG